MTSYNLKPVNLPSLAAQEKKATRQKVLAAVRKRRKEIHKRFDEKKRLQAGSEMI